MVMGRMGLEPILPVKVPVTIGTILNFDGDCDCDGHGVGTCKQTLIRLFLKAAIICDLL